MKTALVCLVAILTQDPLSYVLSAGRSFRSFTVHNHILVGHVFRVIPATDWLSCLLACQDEPRCVSYNFQKVSFGKEACQLSEYGVQECCEGEYLIFAEDCVFHQLKSFQTKKKCNKERHGSLIRKAYRNCHEILQHHSNVSGIYSIDPDDQGAFEVFCDQNTTGGGWTVFQRRMDGSVDFYREWVEYKNGFGNLTGEFWLGLEKVHRLTSATVNSELRVDIEEFGGKTAHATYVDFKVADENSDFEIDFGNYSGTAGDSLAWHKGMPFTTTDSDNGDCDDKCAELYHGAWWYAGLELRSNLNGRYYKSAVREHDGMVWLDWQGFNTSLKATEMKVRGVHV